MVGGGTLFPDEAMPSAHGSLSKRAFGEALGLSPGRVSQLIAAGLPVEPNNRIDLERGRRWYESNVDPNRRRGGRAEEAMPRGDRARLDRIRADRADLQLAVERGELVDRAETERQTFARARAERDAWLGWVSRAAAIVAGETGADPAATFAVLDRLTREHLASLAETALEDIAP